MSSSETNPWSDFEGHEQLVIASDAESGMRALIALHSTALGPALDAVDAALLLLEAEYIQAPQRVNVRARQRLGEAADLLRAVAGEGADGGAGAGRAGEGGVESDGLEAERGIAAGVDEGHDAAVTEAQGNERGFARVVERNGRAGNQGGGPRRPQEHAAVGVVEGEEGFAEKRKAEDAVDFDAEVGGEGGAIVDEGEHVVEARVADRHAVHMRGDLDAGEAKGVFHLLEFA